MLSRATETALGPVPLETPREGDSGTLILRPEQLALTEPSNDRPGGTVASVTFHGSDTVVAVSVAELDSPVEARMPGPVSSRPGDRTGLAVTGTAIFSDVQAVPGSPVAHQPARPN